jgi:hypothetical protein
LIVLLGLVVFVGEHHQRAMLALARMRAQRLGLLVGHPDGLHIAALDGLSPQKKDVHPAIGRPIVAQRQRGKVAGRVFSAPRFHPRAHALRQVRNDAVGNAGVNVGARGLMGGLLGLAHGLSP